MIALALLVGCGASHEQARPTTAVAVDTAPSEEPAPSEPAQPPAVDTSGTQETTAEPERTEAFNAGAGVGDTVEIRLAIMERRAAELEHVATLIVAVREAILHDNTVACGVNNALEELRLLATSGVAGADSAIHVCAEIDAWCVRLTTGRQAEASARDQRHALRALESELSRNESQVRAERRMMLEDAEALRPMVGDR